jgi:Integral membrane protein, interacts with FtsH
MQTFEESDHLIHEKRDQYDDGKPHPISSLIRAQFTRKVFSIVAIQLLFTTFICGLSMKYPSFAQFQANYSYLFILSIIGVLVTTIILSFSDNLSRRVPINFILLGLFTFFEAYLVSISCLLAGVDIVLPAVGLTAFTVLGLTLYSNKAQTEIRTLVGLLISTNAALLGIVLVWIFTDFTILELLIMFICALASGVYFVIDVKAIISKDNLVSIDDYVRGAMILYTDIIRIFLKIVEILMKLKKE